MGKNENPVIINSNGSHSIHSARSGPLGSEDSGQRGGHHTDSSCTSSGFPSEPKRSSSSYFEAGLFQNPMPPSELRKRIRHLKQKFYRYFYWVLDLKESQTALLRRVEDLESENIILCRQVVRLDDRFEELYLKSPPVFSSYSCIFFYLTVCTRL